MNDKTPEKWTQKFLPKSQAGYAYLTLGFVYIILALTLESMLAFLAIGIVFIVIAYQQEDTPETKIQKDKNEKDPLEKKEALTLEKEEK